MEFFLRPRSDPYQLFSLNRLFALAPRWESFRLVGDGKLAGVRRTAFLGRLAR